VENYSKLILKHKTKKQTVMRESEKLTIEWLIEVVLDYREKLNMNGGNVNSIQSIDDSIDLVQVAFLGQIPSGDRQEEIFEDGTELTFKEALKELFVRLENSDYFN
jgi:hypothetical protein